MNPSISLDRRTDSAPPRRLRAACDQCHANKVKCPGGEAPCRRCAESSQDCHYSLAARMGKPPGSKNRKTLERLRARSGDESVGNREDVENSVNCGNGGNFEDGLSRVPQMLAGPLPSPHYDRSTSVQSPRMPSGFPFIGTENVMRLDSADQSEVDFHLSSGSPVNKRIINDLETPTLDYSWLGVDSMIHPSRMNTPMVSSAMDTHRSSISGPSRNARIESSPADSLSAVAASLEEPTQSLHDFSFEHGLMSTPELDGMQGQRRVWPLACRCMRKQTDALCQLQTIEKRQNPVKVDTLLTCANLVSQTTEDYLRCSRCQDDSRTLVQVILIFQTIFSWVQGQCHSSGSACPDLIIKVGQYEISREESRLVKTVLISRALESIKTALKRLSSRVDQLLANRQGKQLWDHERIDLQNLQHLTRSLYQTSVMLTKRLAS